jgi:hypothetical protein
LLHHIGFNEESVKIFTEKNKDWPVISHEGPFWIVAEVKPLDWAEQYSTPIYKSHSPLHS